MAYVVVPDSEIVLSYLESFYFLLGGRLCPSMKNTIGIFWKRDLFALEDEHVLQFSISHKVLDTYCMYTS